MNSLATAAFVMLCVLGGCTTQTVPAVTEVVMAPVDVGTKTPDYEVTSPTGLTLTPGVKLRMLEGPDGRDNGFLLMRGNRPGGFMACGCVGATTSSCKTENDNPEHALCSGTCTDSEGNSQPCQLSGPIIGPPKNPYILKFISRSGDGAPNSTPIPRQPGR